MSTLPQETIRRKRDGATLEHREIAEFIAGVTDGRVSEGQVAAFAMAVFFNGMNREEAVALTLAMRDSGDVLDWSHLGPAVVDKHSTGGVGDKVSLTALPIVAACGTPVAKLSGRGLGTSGGTIDKLESIPGFSSDLSEERFRDQVEEIGLAIIEAGDLAPADKEIYALRDTTGTVDSLPLISSSIVSKKVATGAGHLLYDVKQGSGAFMKTTEEARELAKLLVRLSEDLGIDASALITDMHNPLGSAVGNALEVRESVLLLKNEPVSYDLAGEVERVATRLLELKGIPEAAAAVENALSSGSAYEKFREFVGAQGGDADSLEDLPVSAEVSEVRSPRSGYVARFGASAIGNAALVLGAGRTRKGDRIDPGSGIEILVKPGDPLEEGQPVARLYGERETERAEHLVLEALQISEEPVDRPPAILDSL